MTKKQTINFLIKFTFAVICLMFLTFSVEAQRKKRTPTRRTTTPIVAPVTAPVVKQASQKVSIQIKNVSKFIYVLGGIAKDIETIDKGIKERNILRPQVIEENQRAKSAVVTSIANLQAGLTALETEFQTNPALRQYSYQISGISQLSAQSRGEAAAGQLTQSGKTLLLVIEKLSDALAAMP